MKLFKMFMEKTEEIKEEKKYIFNENSIVINYEKIYGKNSNNNNYNNDNQHEKQKNIISGSEFFEDLIEKENFIELISNLISKNYNNDFGIFLSLLLERHIIKILIQLIKK